MTTTSGALTGRGFERGQRARLGVEPEPEPQPEPWGGMPLYRSRKPVPAAGTPPFTRAMIGTYVYCLIPKAIVM